MEVLTLHEVVNVEINHFTALCSDYPTLSHRSFTMLSVLLPLDHFYEFLVTKDLIQFDLFYFILDPALCCVKLPRINTDWESVLLIHCDFCFHDKLTAYKYVEKVWRAA